MLRPQNQVVGMEISRILTRFKALDIRFSTPAYINTKKGNRLIAFFCEVLYFLLSKPKLFDYGTISFNVFCFQIIE